MKIPIIITIVILLVMAGGAWVYVTRPVEAPTQDLNTLDLVATNDPELFPITSPDPVFVEEDEGSSENTYRVDNTQSEVEFNISEVLRGEEFMVVGTTSDVSGSVTLEDDSIENPQFGTFQINARTLKTDSTNRDGAISRLILQSDKNENELITFEPTASIATTVTGNLTISGVTQVVTFTGVLERLSDTEIAGAYETTIQYKDFDLTIPEVPFVAGVEDELLLAISFIATH